MTRASWEIVNFDRRLDFSDLLGPSFDIRGQACERRVFLFATPRSAGWTACRYLTAAGWGIACEYFGDQIPDLSRRLLAFPEGGAIRHDDLRRYRLALEDSRSRNGIFSSKVFWQEFRRLTSAYSDDVLNASSQLFLYRRDFAAQVVSMAVGMQSLAFSFSDQTFDTGNIRLPKADDVATLQRCARYLLKSERAWFEEFRRRGWRPQLIAAEALLEAPLRIFASLAPRIGLHFDAANLLRCHEFEHNARYESGADSKRHLEIEYAGLLEDYAERRAEQFAREGAAVLQM